MTAETILVVEDNNELREGLRQMLTYEGFMTLAASNGREALQKLEAVTPDLILSDISMPEMDGYSFFLAVRARADWVAIPFIFLTALGDKRDVLIGKNLGAEDYLIKPISQDELVMAVRGRLDRARQVRMAQFQQAYEASLTALANAIDQRDRYADNHIGRVTGLALALGSLLGWRDRRLDTLRFGAILHDIGKICIAEETLLKVEPLTEEEWLEIRQHPLIGAEMIKDIPYLAAVVPVVRSHHERWDGRGYPDGLAGEAILPAARIVTLADSFETMTTLRPYRRALSMTEAYQEVLDCAGKQFDPALVSVFQRAWDLGMLQAILTS